MIPCLIRPPVEDERRTGIGPMGEARRRMSGTRSMVWTLVLAYALTGCASMFGDNRTACRWTSAGVGFAVGGLAGGLAVNSLDLSSTKQGGATIGGVVGGGALGALVGAVIGTQVCPGEAPTTPAAPAPDAEAASPAPPPAQQ